MSLTNFYGIKRDTMIEHDNPKCWIKTKRLQYLGNDEILIFSPNVNQCSMCEKTGYSMQ